MRRCSLALIATLAVLGCSGPTKTGAGTGPTKASLPADVALLTLPPGAKTLQALERVDQRARAGQVAAAWARAHYLVDLFDDARFRRDPTSLETLARVLGRSVASLKGAKGTDAAIASLLVEVDRVLGADRLHRDAQATRTLLELDQKPATVRGQVFGQMSLLKAVARGGSAVADNARLRMFAYCRGALGDVTRARWADRMRVIAHCLYPLFDADPEPYFAADPGARPPPPDVAVLSKKAIALLAPSAAGSGRLKQAALAMSNELTMFLRANAAQIPVPLDPAELSLPQVGYARPYDWAPVLRLGDGRSMTRAALIEDLSMLVRGDGRRVLAVTMPQQQPASALITAAHVARGTKANRLELLVSFDQQLAVPSGDYWSGRADKNRVRRAAVIELSLIPMLAPNLRPRGPRRSWDSTRASLQLHLTIERDRWRLFGPTGEIANMSASGGSAAGELRAALARVRAAFDFETALVLVPSPDVTFGAVIAAADAARRDTNGDDSFTQLGLALTAPKVTSNGLARRIERRRRAKVSVVPSELGRQTRLLRRCYQERLEDKATLTGTVRLELRGDSVVVLSGPTDRGLRSCVLQSLQVPMVKGKVASAEVSVKPK